MYSNNVCFSPPPMPVDDDENDFDEFNMSTNSGIDLPISDSDFIQQNTTSKIHFFAVNCD
jgi:hypothetical protein